MPYKDPEKNRACRRTYKRKVRQQNPELVREAGRIEAKKWRTKNHEQYHDRHLRRKFGIGLLQFNSILNRQNNRCAICGSDTPGGRSKVFHVDHCHDTGVVRGLLCHHCNIGIGNLKDDPAILRAAANYLEAAHVRTSA